MARPAGARSGPFRAILRYNQEPARPLGGLESSYWGQRRVPGEWLTQGWVQLAQGRAVFFPVCSTLALSPLPQGGLGGSPLICPAGPLMDLQSLLSTPRLQPCQLGPGSPPGVSSLVEGTPLG